ncbi:MAG: PAS domain S-box protein [Acidobacteria bacterium]|nr:PAS domain S-box protein [Acidobacteriota bacterium]
MKLRVVPDELSRSVTLALLSMEEGGPAAAAMESAGWTIPASYQSVHECMKELRLGPCRDFGKVTLADALRQHWDKVILFLLGLAALRSAAAFWLLRLNRRLHVAGKSLRERETQFRMVVENQGEGVVVVDASENFIFCNPAAEEIFGVEPGKLLGRNLEQFVCPEHFPAIPEQTEKRRSRARSVYEVEIARSDGQRRHLLVTATPQFDSGGQVRGTFGIFRDITERKRLEEQLRQAHKLESVGRLAGGVAHDFNNLLTVINGYSEMALARLGEASPLRAQIEPIRKAGGRAAELTQQLLAFSRKQVIQPKPLDLNSVVLDAVEMLARLVGEDVELITRLNPAPLPVLVDAGQMHRVLMNLAAKVRETLDADAATGSA